MFENFGHFFKKVVNQDVAEEVDSKLAAKERLQLVLMQDRANVSADFLELMKQEILDVVKKYIEIDESTIDVRLTTQVNEDGTNGEPTLYANIPIVNIKNELKAEKISNQLEFADLIEAQNKEEIKNAKGQESSLFKQASTQETVVLNDETMQKISEELNTQKQEEKQAKKAEKQAKQEEKKQNAIKAKEDKAEASSKSDKTENSSDKTEPKKVVEQSKQEDKKHIENKPNSAKEEVHNKPKIEEDKKVEENKESRTEEHKKEESKFDINAETQSIKKDQAKQKSSLELLKDAIEQEAADLEELQKELDLAADEFSIDDEMSLLDELDDDDDEDEDFVTFDDLYQAAQEADKKKEINKKNKAN